MYKSTRIISTSRLGIYDNNNYSYKFTYFQLIYKPLGNQLLNEFKFVEDNNERSTKS